VRREVFSGDGCLGGRCSCGAVFVIDETGREGGRARLDLLALAADGDLDRALDLDGAGEVTLKHRDLGGGVGRFGRRMPAQGQLPPKVWFALVGGAADDQGALPGLGGHRRKRLRINRRRG
jgi:hypothetical protein